MLTLLPYPLLPQSSNQWGEGACDAQELWGYRAAFSPFPHHSCHFRRILRSLTRPSSAPGLAQHHRYVGAGGRASSGLTPCVMYQWHLDWASHGAMPALPLFQTWNTCMLPSKLSGRSLGDQPLCLSGMLVFQGQLSVSGKSTFKHITPEVRSGKLPGPLYHVIVLNV